MFFLPSRTGLVGLCWPFLALVDLFRAVDFKQKQIRHVKDARSWRSLSSTFAGRFSCVVFSLGIDLRAMFVPFPREATSNERSLN